MSSHRFHFLCPKCHHHLGMFETRCHVCLNKLIWWYVGIVMWVLIAMAIIVIPLLYLLDAI